MAGVPDQAIELKVERLVQGQAELHDAQIRRKMRAAATDQVAKDLAHFARQPLELRQRKPAQVLRAANLRQNWFFCCAHRFTSDYFGTRTLTEASARESLAHASGWCGPSA
jgi:hypothetical protein